MGGGKISRGCVAACAVLALSTLPARAGDGVRELSQACVVNGCVSDDEPGFPIELNADGHYRLTSPLIVPNANTTAIAVASDYVVLDLNGFLVTGVTYCTGTPTTSCAPTGSGSGIDGVNGRVEVRNGIVRGFGLHGIRAGSAIIVDGVRIEENGGDGIVGVAGAVDWIVRNSMIRRNGGNGISMSGSSWGVLITGNAISGNRLAGLVATKGTVSNNVVNANGGLGLATGDGVGITGNTFSNNNAGGSGQQVSPGQFQLGPNQCQQILCPP